MNDLIVSVEEARELLGKGAEKMTDDEVEKLIRDMDQLVRLIFKMFRERELCEK